VVLGIVLTVLSGLLAIAIVVAVVSYIMLLVKSKKNQKQKADNQMTTESIPEQPTTAQSMDPQETTNSPD